MSEVKWSQAEEGSGSGDKWLTILWRCLYAFWWRVCIAAGVGGVICALSRWDLAAVISLPLTAAVCMTAVAAVVGQEAGRAEVWRLFRAALVCALAVTAVAGLVVVLGALGLVLVLVLAGTGAVFTTGAGDRWRTAINPPEGDSRPGTREFHLPDSDRNRGGEIEAIRPSQDLRLLDDAALCLAWRRSFILLQERRCVLERMYIVEQRQKYLD